MALQTVNAKLAAALLGYRQRLGGIFASVAVGAILVIPLPGRLAAATESPSSQVTQQAGDADEAEVSSGQIDKYVAVYKAMQRDRSLTAEAAAAENGMTLEAFRALESRVQRDEAALLRVRRLLQASAQHPQPTASP